jgi:hypothetical protein
MREFRGSRDTETLADSEKVLKIGPPWARALVSKYHAKSGITVNGVAPALIQETTMLPGNNEELANSM